MNFFPVFSLFWFDLHSAQCNALPLRLFSRLKFPGLLVTGTRDFKCFDFKSATFALGWESKHLRTNQTRRAFFNSRFQTKWRTWTRLSQEFILKWNNIPFIRGNFNIAPEMRYKKTRGFGMLASKLTINKTQVRLMINSNSRFDRFFCLSKYW